MGFKTNRITMHPISSGYHFGDLTDAQLRNLTPDLTEEESASSFATYYRAPMAPISQEALDALDGPPILLKDAVFPWEYGEKMNHPGNCAVECGYCLLPGNIGYAAMRVFQPDRRDADVDYYNRHFAPVGDLAYKSWYPGAHIRHYVDGAVEDLGWGRLNMHFLPEVSMLYYGLELDKVAQRDPGCIRISQNRTLAYNLDKPDEPVTHMTLMIYHREIPGGRELRLRGWLGAYFDENGTICRSFVDSPQEVLARAKMLTSHLAYEYHNEVRLIREFAAGTYL